MASNSSRSDENYSCSVCFDIFKDPVVLSCSHSFCKSCLEEWWREKKIKECPLCKERHSNDPPCNRALKNLCEDLIEEKHQRASTGSEVLCSLHAEKFKLFCLECEQPVCVVCRDSKKHINHSFRPTDEAAPDHKEEVQKSLKPLQDKLKVFNTFKTNYDQTAEHIKVQTQHTEMQMKEQFKMLHQFLQKEEEARIKALRDEEQQKSQMMKEKVEGLNRDILTLSHKIRAIEEELRAEDIAFLQNYKTTMERVQFTLQDPQPVSGALIDVTKHLNNLTFSVWDKMKDIVSYTPVILDPNTAHPGLILSDDLTSVRRGPIQHFPDNPERFDKIYYVLGSEGFNSGIHSWDVEVGNNPNWTVGVLAKSFERKGTKGFSDGTKSLFKHFALPSFAENKIWGIELNEGQYRTVRSSRSGTLLLVSQKPQRIRVQMDCTERMLSFSDPDTDTQIHTVERIRAVTVFPCINPGHTFPLKMLPGKVSVVK